MKTRPIILKKVIEKNGLIHSNSRKISSGEPWPDMLRRPNEAEADDADRAAANNRVRAYLKKKEKEDEFFFLC